MSQITIRNIPQDFERSIRELSERQGVSLNKTLIGLLEEAIRMESSLTAKKRDLSRIAGRWTSVEATEFECLDEELSK